MKKKAAKKNVDLFDPIRAQLAAATKPAKKPKARNFDADFVRDVEDLFGPLSSRRARRNLGRAFRAIPGQRPAYRARP